MRSTAVTFESAGARLSGTLTLPSGEGPHPVAVLLHGASWGLRSMYGAFVEAFVEAGAGCLAYDRRGEGGSEGSAVQDIFAFAADARAAFEHVRRLSGVDSARTGLWGYSNGAWVAALAASGLADCAFLVLTGASAVSPGASEAFRRTEDLHTQGIAQRTLEAVHATWLIVFDYLANAHWRPDWDSELAEHRAVIEGDSALAELPVSDMVRAMPWLDSVPRFGSAMFQGLRAERGATNPDMGFEPLPALRNVHCPILAVLAENDENLPSTESARRFAELAAERPPGAFTVHVIPGVGHQFGVDVRFPPVPPRRSDFVDGYLRLMAGWLRANTR